MTSFVLIVYAVVIAFMLCVLAEQARSLASFFWKLVELDREIKKLKAEIEKLKLLSRAVDGSLRDHQDCDVWLVNDGPMEKLAEKVELAIELGQYRTNRIPRP